MSTSSIDQKQPLQPTVGCEFEFILLIRKDSGMGPEDGFDDNIARDQITEALRNPLKVICEQCKHESVFRLPIHSEETDNYSKWQVVHERTHWLHLDEVKLLGKDYQNYDIHPLELQSRIFETYKQSSVLKSPCQHRLTMSEEITAVLNRLNHVFRRFDAKRNQAKRHFLHINRKCGFHVHVGSHGRPFSLATTKRLLSLFVACEKQIDQLHSTDRITGFDLGKPPHALPRKPFPEAPIIDPETYNLPYSMLFIAEANRRRWEDFNLQGGEACNSAFKAVARPFVGKIRWLEKSYSKQDMWIAKRLDNIDAWLIRTRTCNNIGDLQNLLQAPGKRSTLNIDNLSDNIETAKLGTIEFRQHKGTLQPDEACSFIDFAVSLVRFCHNMGDGLYNAFDGPGRKYRQPNFTLQELCANIECRPWTQAHFHKKHDTSLTHFSIWLDEQRKHFEEVSYDDPMKHLALYAINDEIKRTDPSNVQQRIKQKLLGVGYGRFPLKYLEAALPDKTAKGSREVDHLDNRYVVDVHPANVNKATPGSDPMSVDGYSSEDDEGSEEGS